MKVLFWCHLGLWHFLLSHSKPDAVSFGETIFLSCQSFSVAVLFFPGVALRGNFSFPPLVATPVKYCSGCGEEVELEHKATVFASKICNSSELWFGTYITKRGGRHYAETRAQTACLYGRIRGSILKFRCLGQQTAAFCICQSLACLLNHRHVSFATLWDFLFYFFPKFENCSEMAVGNPYYLLFAVRILYMLYYVQI